MMMKSPRVKYSGSKIPLHSDFRARGTRGDTPSKNLKIQFCNIRGLNKNINDVHHHLQAEKPDILALTETQVNSSTNKVHMLCPGYELHSRFRFKGGVCLYSKSNISCQREESLEPKDFDVMWFKLADTKQTKFLCCLYLSPNEPSYSDLFEFLSLKLDFIQQNHPTAEVIIMGDFNVHNSTWLKFSNKTDEAGRQAEAFAITYGLEQLVELPTRIPDVNNQYANTLDLFLTNNPDPYSIEVCAPLGNSDHNLISTLCSFSTPSSSPRLSRLIWHYNSADWDGLRMFFSAFPWERVCFSLRDPTQCAESISEIIMLGMQTYIPNTSRGTSFDKPWFSKNCSRAVALKQAAYHRWLKNQGTETRSEYVEARNICKETIESSKEAYNAKIRSKLVECPNGSRSFWSFAKAVGRNFTSSSFPPLTKEDGTLATNAQEKANIFAKMFAANSTLDSLGKQPQKIIPIDSHMPEIIFRQRTIRHILLGLDINKASGSDGIPSIVLKKCAPELTPILCKLFNLSYNSGVFPSNWKIARVQPVPKKGKKTLPSNYRPIALLSVISKVMEKAINIELIKYLERSGIINDRQYGFRHQRSTGDLLAYVSHIWQQSIEKYGETLAVALDISKAFDRVWHQGLLAKLPSYGLPPQLCSLLSSFLSDRSLHVVVDGVSSDTLPINAGVPQGSILAPTLFLLHINDLLGATSCPVHSFADDSTLHTAFSSKAPISASECRNERGTVVNEINTDLAKILEWGSNNLVEFNANKTQACLFSRKADLTVASVTMSGVSIPMKSSISMLGITISSTLSWENHVRSIAKSASQKLGFLFRAKKYFTSRQLIMIYKAQIRPVLEYCSHIWSAAPKHTLKLLDSVQKRAIRLVGDTSLTSSLTSLEHRRKVGDLSLFYRYFHGRCSSEISSIVPPLAVPSRLTRRAQSSHPYTVTLETCRTSVSQGSFFHRTAKLWNSLPREVFPEAYSLQKFKKNTNSYLLSLGSHDVL